MGQKQRLRAERRMAATAEKQNLSVKFSVSDEPEEGGIEIDLDDAGSSQVQRPVEQEALPAGGTEVEIELPPEDEDDGEDPIEALARQKKELDEARKATADLRKEKEDSEARLRADSERDRAEREATEAKWREEQNKRAELEEYKIKQDREELKHHQVILEHAYAAAQTERLAAEQAFADAASVGDYQKFGQLQTAISEAVVKQNRIAEGYERLKEQIEAPLPEFVREPEPEPRQVQQTQQPASDPFEAWIAKEGANLLDADKAYLRQRKEFIQSDPRNSMILQSAANLAEMRYRLKPGTPEYHNFIDVELGLAEEGNEAEEPVAVAPPPVPSQNGRRPVQKRPTAAPGSRATASSSPTKIFLTDWDRDQAKSLGISEKEYATYKAKANDGQLTQGQAGGRLMARYSA